MAKLPVNLLLYSLYAASAGLIGGIGWTFYATWQLKKEAQSPPFHTTLAAQVDSHLEAGRKAQPERKNWRYDAEMLEWWKQFDKVNIIGELPPPPEEEKKDAPPPPPPTSRKPLDDLIVLESLLLDVTKATGDEIRTHVVVRYKPGVTVNPPAEMVPGSAGQGAWGPGDAVPRPAGGPTTQVPMPTGAQTELRQFVRLEETLWPPHNNLRLVEVSEDGQTAYFLREDPAKQPSEWEKERLDKNELDLPPDVVSALLDQRREGGSGKGEKDATETSPSTMPDNPVSEWIDPPQTGEVKPGQVQVSRRDYDYIRENSDRVFNDEIAVSNYRSPRGTVEGLMVRHVSPRLAQFGIKAGDVILSVNGEKVKNKANAYAVGRRQYDAGTRRFVVEILSNSGMAETRTFTIPKK